MGRTKAFGVGVPVMFRKSIDALQAAYWPAVWMIAIAALTVLVIGAALLRRRSRRI